MSGPNSSPYDPIPAPVREALDILERQCAMNGFSVFFLLHSKEPLAAGEDVVINKDVGTVSRFWPRCDEAVISSPAPPDVAERMLAEHRRQS